MLTRFAFVVVAMSMVCATVVAAQTAPQTNTPTDTTTDADPTTSATDSRPAEELGQPTSAQLTVATVAEPMAAPDDVERLRGFMEEAGSDAPRLLAGVTSIVSGIALGIMSGVWLADQRSSVDAVVFSAFASIAPLGVVGGITLLLTPRPNELRWNAFRASTSMTVRELARYEGDLRASADLGRFQRSVGVGYGIGTVATGITLSLIGGFYTPASGLSRWNSDQREVLVGAGIGLAVSGVLIAVLTGLIESPEESAWRRYANGETSPSARPGHVSLRVTPYASDLGAGLLAAGAF